MVTQLLSKAARAAPTPFRAFSSCSSCGFASTSTAPAPKESSTGQVIHLWDKVTALDKRNAEQPSDILKHLSNGSRVISPGHLSPHYLLQPYLPKGDEKLAYPLGPPVSKRDNDAFIRLGLNPLSSPMNPYLRTEFCTSMGKIKGRGETQLQRSSQRKMGKAVRRARAMGLTAYFGRSVSD